MRRLLRWYGAGPLHLLAFLGCFALAGYAAARLVPSRPLGIAVWFLGAVIGHDLVLMPLYSLADSSASAAIRHRGAHWPALPWINYLRVPAALSGLLLLVWFPLILRLRTRYQASTTLSPTPFLWHWLAVTGALFLLSAAALALRIRALRRPAGDGGRVDEDVADENPRQGGGEQQDERDRGEDPGDAASRPVAHHEPQPDDDRRGQQVPSDVAVQRAEDRRGPPDGHGPEPVECPGGTA
jgi:hypothetical protein